MIRNADPFTVEIIQNSLHAICEEMFAVMKKTAMSSIIYEVLDFGVGLTNARGELAAQGAGVPVFIGTLDAAVKAVLRKFDPKDDICPGDIFITNDCYSGGVTHLNDVDLLMPVFDGRRLVAWTANKAHWGDIGGMVAGGISTEATELYQEGLQFPEVKLFEGGRQIQSVIDMIAANSRTPDYILGDMWAGIASLRAGERRLAEMAERYGFGALEYAMESVLDIAEAAARRGLAELPNGVYEAEDRTDDGLTIRATVTVTDDEFTVDLRDNPDPVAGPFNCPYLCTVAGARVTFKALTSPLGVSNGGSFRPLKVITRKNSMFDTERPHSNGMYVDAMMYTTELIWKAMAPLAPERLGTGNLHSVCGTIFAATHPETGRYLITVEPELGGWGAAHDADGENGQYCVADGETYNCPVEVAEARNGIFIDQYAFHNADGGEGTFRGGKGVVLDYRIRAADAQLTGLYSRTNGNPPWGLQGGREGSLNALRVLRVDGSVESYNRISALKLAPGDVVRIVTATGGGYGDPKKRPPENVLADVKNGFVTPEQALRHYGVAV